MKKIVKGLLIGFVVIIILGGILGRGGNETKKNNGNNNIVSENKKDMDKDESKAEDDNKNAENNTKNDEKEEIKEDKNTYKFGPGMYKVGVDVEPGEYMVLGDGFGYYQISSDSSGEFSSIISNDNFKVNRYITLVEGQYLTLKNSYLYDIDKVAALENQEMYRVGRDIAPGEYMLIATGRAYYQVSKDSSGDIGSIISNDNFSVNRYITIQNDQYIIVKGCKIVGLENVPEIKDKEMYKIGVDLKAGEYQLQGDGRAYYEIRTDSKGGFEGILSNDNFEGNSYITVKDGQYLILRNAKLK